MGFSDEEVSICANITSVLEMLIVWNKALPTYREGDEGPIYFNNSPHYMVVNREGIAIGVQGGVINGVANVL